MNWRSTRFGEASSAVIGKIFELWLACYTQREIAERLDVDVATTNLVLKELLGNGDIAKIQQFANSDPEYRDTEFFNYDVFTRNACKD